MNSTATYSVQFNGKGTHLLCCEDDRPSAVYNLSAALQKADSKIVLAKGLLVAGKGCFAGENDQLVVATSWHDNNMNVWSVTDDETDLTMDNQPLLALSGPQDGIHGVRYCKATSTLASASNAGIVKLWMPKNL